MTGLLIFVEIALAGCAFLIYFLYKLWRDSRESRIAPRGDQKTDEPIRTQGKTVAAVQRRRTCQKGLQAEGAIVN